MLYIALIVSPKIGHLPPASDVAPEEVMADVAAHPHRYDCSFRVFADQLAADRYARATSTLVVINFGSQP